MGRARKKVLAGTHRQCRVGETLERVLPLLGRFEITRLANITGLDDVGIPTVMATRPNARSLSVSQGKGVTLEAAKVSAIFESIEQWHAEHTDLPVRLGSYRERARVRPLLNPELLPRYARSWDPDARLLWVEARSVRAQEPVEVPFELVHLDLRLPLPAGSGYFPIGSNGLSSGNSLEEALVHGACELIERDATAVFYKLPPAVQAKRRLRLSTVDDPLCKGLLDRFFAAGVGVAVWDLTSDLGIATFLCSVVEREFDPFRRVGLSRGFGCHLDSATALSRALCEAAQSRLTRIAGSRDDFQESEVDFIRDRESIRLQQRQLEEESSATRAFSETPSRCLDFVEDDLEWIHGALARAGLDQLVYVDLSRDDVGVAVVRVIIPGLEGSADVPGYVPGARAQRAALGVFA